MDMNMNIDSVAKMDINEESKDLMILSIIFLDMVESLRLISKFKSLDMEIYCEGYRILNRIFIFYYLYEKYEYYSLLTFVEKIKKYLKYCSERTNTSGIEYECFKLLCKEVLLTLELGEYDSDKISNCIDAMKSNSEKSTPFHDSFFKPKLDFLQLKKLFIIKPARFYLLFLVMSLILF